jgi:predicted nucleic acid-binding protein
VIFGDTSFFVGLVDSRDQWHSRAAKLANSLPKEILVSDFVVAESVTIIGSRGGGRAPLALYEYFRDSCEIEFVDPELLASSMQAHLRYDGRLSLADCVSLTLMGRRGLSHIVSFDADFDRVKGLNRIS